MKFPPLNVITRYIDQALYAATFLLINLAPPLLMPDAEAATILYLASWALLGSTISASLFGTPFLANYSSSRPWLLRETLKAYFLFFCICLCIASVATTLPPFNSDVFNPSFFFFVILLSGTDLLRRLFLAQHAVLASFTISLSTCIAIGVGLTSYIYNSTLSMLWVTSSLVIIPFFLTAAIYLYIKSPHGLPLGKEQFKHHIQMLKFGTNSLVSFLFAWAATQGLFVYFYDRTPSTAFIQQKTLFTTLGIFSLALAVQENKYQPLFSEAVTHKDFVTISRLRKSISTENLYLLLISTAVTLPAWLFYAQTSIGALVALILYRHLFAISKTPVYTLRCFGLYSVVMVINWTACALGFLTAYTLLSTTEYSISYALAAYSIGFYLLIARTQDKTEKKIVGDWHS